MKTTLYLLVVSAAACSLNVSTSSGQALDSVKDLNNRAVAASPRAKETFPWLTRSTVADVTPTKASDSKTALADVAQNCALAASPRTLEQFPELARPAQPVKATDTPLALVVKNRAFALSPRALEEFPWLARGSFTVTEQPTQAGPRK